MNTYILLLTIITFATIVTCQQSYTTRYDNVNIDNILSNNRLRNNYIKCLLGEGKCNPEGATLKQIVPDALKTACKKCNPLQRRAVTKIAKYMMKNQPKDWEKLTKKYDPKGEFTEEYKELLKES